ncbi:hypothetical protein M422DRAFT_44325 [Sphaerobolus stellatus SS14]|nr:hypothetical protein M422DRAFT_44325 [Sphaerobolus stellatus SS14]
MSGLQTVFTQPSLLNASAINAYYTLNELSVNATPFPYIPTDSYCVDFLDIYYLDLPMYNLDDDNNSDINFPDFDSWTTCPVTGEMINFLNLTRGKSLDRYFTAYCALGAPTDDGCPYGWCPNSDIAVLAPLIRIASYVITSLTTIILYYNREAVTESFWTQLLTIYSFLITSIISMSKGELTRIHAVIATGLVGSPLSIYIFIYAIRSIWGGLGKRMEKVLGKGAITARILVILACGIWIFLIIFILVPDSNSKRFSQRACERDQFPLVFQGYFFLPLVIIKFFLDDKDTKSFGGVLVFVVVLPIAMMVFAWIIAIIRRRREIWPAGEPYSLKWHTVW